MCLLLNKKAGNVISREWLDDFYSYNPDGIGVMWADAGAITVVKVVPNNVQDIYDFFDEHVGDKECSIHFRWRTHGDTDILNCHPYEVLTEEEHGYPLYLMHNGVLDSGNHADTTKSDTWHYINNIIRPALLADPTQFTAPWFKTLIEDHIGGSNKFVMMDALGNVVTFNEKAGVMWEGNWMSNTYAWSAPIERPSKVWGSYNNHKSGYNDTNLYDLYDSYDYAPAKVATIKNTKQIPQVDGKDEDWQLRIEAWEFAEEFIESCVLWGMNIAAQELSKYVIKAAYLEDKEYCLEVISDLENGYIDEEDVISAFNGEQSYAASYAIATLEGRA